MKNILPLIAGLSVNKEFEIYEGFFVQVDEAKNRYSIVANIDGSKMAKVFFDLIKALGSELTFIVEHQDGESKTHIFKQQGTLADWDVKDLDWILQDGFTTLRVKDEVGEEVFAGPLQVCYVNTKNLKEFKRILRHWFIRQQTHLKTMYSIAQDRDFVINQKALKLNGQSLLEFLSHKFNK